MADEATNGRPWYFGPLGPIGCAVIGIGLILAQGIEPYQIWLKKRSWKKVTARLVRPQVKAQRLSGRAGRARLRYYRKRVEQRQIYLRTVEKGWLVKRKEQVWSIRISYSFRYKKERFTKVHDSPSRDFESKKAAFEFLRRNVKNRKQGIVQVWMNPKNPRESSAFMMVESWAYFRFGVALFGLGIAWFIVAITLRSKEEKPPKSDSDAQDLASG